jgi:hypothetical protein
MHQINTFRHVLSSHTQFHLSPDKLLTLSQVYDSVSKNIATLKTDVVNHKEHVEDKRKIEFHDILIALCESLQKKLANLTYSLASNLGQPIPDRIEEYQKLTRNTIYELFLSYCAMNSYQVPDEFKELTVKDRFLNFAGAAHKTTSTTHTFFIRLKALLVNFHIRIGELFKLQAIYAQFLNEGSTTPLLHRAIGSYEELCALHANPDHLIGIFNDPFVSYYKRRWIQTCYPDFQVATPPGHPEHIPLSFDLASNCMPADNFRMTVLGCHGMDGSFISAMKDKYLNPHPDAQLAVARELRKTEPHINLQLGDNVYYDGLPSFVDMPALKYFQHNQELYGRTASFKPLPNWILPGNHDYGFWGHASKSERLDPSLARQTHLQRIFNQVFHTFAVNDHWNMPHRYYVLNHEHFVLFMLDTNMLIFDSAQQRWFVNTLLKLKAKYPNKWIIVAGHHPLFYLDKVEQDCEWRKYYELMQERGHNIGQLGLYKKSSNSFTPIPKPIKKRKHEFNHMGQFLVTLIRANKLPIDVWLCAHEHLMAKIDATFDFGEAAGAAAAAAGPARAGIEHKICQLTCGGGGAKLRDINANPNAPEFLGDYEHAAVTHIESSFYAKLHGFMELNITAREISCQPHLLGWAGELPKASQFYNVGEFSTGVHGQVRAGVIRARAA